MLLHCLAAALVALARNTAPAENPRVEHAIVIAVDGLRSDALLVSPRNLPALRRLMDEGAFTLNARTDPDITVTLPNHLGMVTSRLMLGDEGHHWERNDLDDETLPNVLHDARGEYIESMFDVAHDHGMSVSIIAGKTKLHLLNNSWGEERGVEDVIGDDNGRTKIDTYVYDEAIGAVATRIVETLKNCDRRQLVFASYRHTDATGHESGWDLTRDSPYMRTLAEVDREIGRILDAIASDARLHGKVAIIVTADHGGGAPYKSHTMAHMWVNYIIPFIVWTGPPHSPAGSEARGGSAANSSGQASNSTTNDLYSLNPASRLDPGLSQPPYDSTGLPPIRNSDAANLALHLLGLPPIDGSTVNAKQDLVIIDQ